MDHGVYMCLPPTKVKQRRCNVKSTAAHLNKHKPHHE